MFRCESIYLYRVREPIGSLVKKGNRAAPSQDISQLRIVGENGKTKRKRKRKGGG